MSSDASHDRMSFQELRELNEQLDRQLREGPASSGPASATPEKSRSRSGRRSWGPGRILGTILLLAAAIVLPFVVLVRVSTWTYAAWELNGWLALGAGVAGTVVLLLAYLLYASLRFRSGAWRHRYLVRGSAVLVVAYCVYALIYISSLNTKTENVRTYYRTLHPVMRVAVTTVSLADDRLLLTDIGRTPEDYRAMGLTPRQQSMHYVQESGYVHAVDLRTIGRAEWKNFTLKWLFEGLGFETLRHTGTADHLHVYLPLNDS
ncbi:MAG: hypothetical protein U5K31_08630 [Balneolaceae bacterium]|nr:hypothetical protein [Balneolaceae bacterium]